MREIVELVLNAVILCFIGIAGGIAVGAGFVAFLTILGIVPRLMQISNSYEFIRAYEWAIIIGSLASSLMGLLEIKLYLPSLFLMGIGLLCGLFIGMLAAALTEVLNVFPILTKRIGLQQKVTMLVMAIVLGKICGSLFQWLYFVLH